MSHRSESAETNIDTHKTTRYDNQMDNCLPAVSNNSVMHLALHDNVNFKQTYGYV